MYPFSSKPRPLYQAIVLPDSEKSLDTAAAEPRFSHTYGSFFTPMPDPVQDKVDAESFTQMEGLVSRCPVAQRCVDLRADKLSSVAVVTSGGVQGQALMASPNARHKTLSQNVFMWANDLTLVGELWLMLDLSIRGRPQLFRARPDLLVRDPKTNRVTYDDGRASGQKNPRFQFTFDDAGDCVSCVEFVKGVAVPYPGFLLRIQHHNPASDASGKGSVRAVSRSIQTWLEIAKLIEVNVKRGGVRHAASVSGSYTDAEWADIKSRMQSAAAANSIPVLPGTQLIPTGDTFTEMGIIEIKEAVERDIATGLGVQPVMIGMKDETEYAAQRGAERIFYKTWVKPEAEWLFDQLAAHLRIYLNEPDLSISIDDANLSFTEDDRFERAEKMKALGSYSINEIREVLGATRVDGGDAIPGVTAPESSVQASREVDRALGTQTPAEAAVDAALKPREVGLNADTDGRKPVEPADAPLK